jgi:ADP-heptose:LPS heptosyltransferase
MHIKIIRELLHYMNILLVDFFLIYFTRCSKTKHGLLIVRLDAIGDFFLWAESANAYRDLFPDTHITLLGNNKWTLIAKKLNFWDEIIEIEIDKFYISPIYRFNIMKYLRNRGFEVAIQTVVSRRFSNEDLVMRAINASQKIGADGDHRNSSSLKMTIGNHWYNHLIQVHVRDDLSVVKLNNQFLEKLGVKKATGLDESIFSSITQKGSIKNVIEKITLGVGYYIIFPGAGSLYRRWPIDRFQKISDLIYEHYGLKGIICGGAGEESLGMQIAYGKKDLQLINLVGKTSILELIELIKNARFVLGNESCGIHIAALVKTKNLCILGGGDFGRFVPYSDDFRYKITPPAAIYNKMECFGCNWKRPCYRFLKCDRLVPCILSISIDAVWIEVQKTIEKSG